MWRVLMIAIAGVLCTACSGGISSYQEAIEAQSGIMAEMVSILEGVTDEASADKASKSIEALGNRLDEIASQIKGLPEPTLDELQEIAQEQDAQRQEFQEKAMPQMMKLAEYKSLSDAWTRAQANMR